MFVPPNLHACISSVHLVALIFLICGDARGFGGAFFFTAFCFGAFFVFCFLAGEGAGEGAGDLVALSWGRSLAITGCITPLVAPPLCWYHPPPH